ncbi:flavodoxin family protein [Amphiplicatus metriothermophilus]|nr:NAD(P)H-dependent oxidoreductase [Amphiplicatus metriothermophilus]MBB5518080.1 hypothetical protein [Amphiplicatus metriothermophilus]
MAGHLRAAFARRGEDSARARASRRAAPPVAAVLGSARSDGNTRALVDAVFPRASAARVIDLNDLAIGPYDYAHRHEADDFLPLLRSLAQARAVVFATPVYWYSMSGRMKTFFDRLTDATGPHKPLGRALAGRRAFALVTSASEEAPPGFETPFAETARYFAMRWGGMLHVRFGEDRRLAPEAQVRAAAFADRIARALREDAA